MRMREYPSSYIKKINHNYSTVLAFLNLPSPKPSAGVMVPFGWLGPCANHDTQPWMGQQH